MIGERIGAYTILQQIGEGGMGTVWIAEHAMLGRRAAIKMLHAGVSGHPDITTRFFNEARAAAAIQDPGIVQIFDFGQHTDGRAYIVMELLEGEPLDRRLNRLGRLPVRDALRIMRQVASSLGAAHKRGIVHRDLKPDNVFLVRDAEVAGGERAKILDFGIAKIVDASGLKTDTAVVMGTPMFMSPEQCRGAGKVDQRTDVYSLGCLLFTLITGRTPFLGEGPGDIIAMHLREMPPVPSTLSADIPHSVDSLVLRCMEKDPARRYDSALEVAEALEKIHAVTGARAASMHDETGTSASSIKLSHPTTLSPYSKAEKAQVAKRGQSRGGWWFVGGVAATLAVTTVVVLSLRDGEAPTRTISTNSPSPGENGLTPGDRQQSEPPPPEPIPPSAPEPAPLGSLASKPEPTPAPALPAPAPVLPKPAPAPVLPKPAPAPVLPKPAPALPKPAPVLPKPAPAPVLPKPTPAPVLPKPAPALPKPAPALPKPAPVPVLPKPAPAPGLPKAALPAPAPAPTAEETAAVCAAQIEALNEFIRLSYGTPAQEQVRRARRLGVSCLNRNQRIRLALSVIPAACSLDDQASVLHFYDLAESAALRARCVKFLSDTYEEDAQEESEE